MKWHTTDERYHKKSVYQPLWNRNSGLNHTLSFSLALIMYYSCISKCIHFQIKKPPIQKYSSGYPSEEHSLWKSCLNGNEKIFSILSYLHIIVSRNEYTYSLSRLLPHNFKLECNSPKAIINVARIRCKYQGMDVP